MSFQKYKFLEMLLQSQKVYAFFNVVRFRLTLAVLITLPAETCMSVFPQVHKSYGIFLDLIEKITTVLIQFT